MEETTSMGYANFQDFEVLAVPYAVPDLQFLIILPKVKTTVAQVERGMTAQMIAELAQLPSNRVRLFLPKFKIQPITLGLSAQLKALGMETAFHQGRADFRRIDSKRDLFVEEVFHRVFIVVDEQGTEAAAASAAVSGKTGRTLISPPIEFKVDRPFVFAIQHRPSGACLFLGHVSDPR
jgi:serpin B